MLLPFRCFPPSLRRRSCPALAAIVGVGALRIDSEPQEQVARDRGPDAGWDSQPVRATSLGSVWSRFPSVVPLSSLQYLAVQRPERNYPRFLRRLSKCMVGDLGEVP